MIDQVWPYVCEGVQRAISKTGGDYSAHLAWTACRSGNAFLFVVQGEDKITAASIWRFETWETGSKVRCLALYGESMDEWIKDMHEAVKTLARQGGANGIVSEGREGWPKVFPDTKKLRSLYEEKI